MYMVWTVCNESTQNKEYQPIKYTQYLYTNSKSVVLSISNFSVLLFVLMQTL